MGGADTVTVNDLTGTDTTQVAIDLAATPGSGQGDGAADTVIANGTAGADTIKVVSSGGSIAVNGLAAQVTINGADAGTDSLVVNGGLGDDVLDASKLTAGRVNLTLNGGDGAERTTFGNIALYRTSLFRQLPRGKKLRMLPFYRDWIARGWASGELFVGRWANVGTAAELASLDSELLGNALPRETR